MRFPKRQLYSDIWCLHAGASGEKVTKRSASVTGNRAFFRLAALIFSANAEKVLVTASGVKRGGLEPATVSPVSAGRRLPRV